jgi:hypothetical protein
MDIVLWSFIALKSHRPQQNLNSRILGPMARTLPLDHRESLPHINISSAANEILPNYIIIKREMAVGL